MKLIEAMKKVKSNKEEIADLQNKIANNCANLSFESPVYGDGTAKKIAEWAQACDDLTQNNISLLCSIQKTNIATDVTIILGEKSVKKTIAEWVWRRREYAAIDLQTWSKLNDRGLKEGQSQTSTGIALDIKVVRHFDPLKRDLMIDMYRKEPSAIDSALETVNAITDLI